MLGVWTEYFLEGTKFWPGALSTLDFGILTSLRAPIKISFWDQWETAILGQFLARSPFGARFWHFGSRPGPH